MRGPDDCDVVGRGLAVGACLIAGAPVRWELCAEASLAGFICDGPLDELIS